MTQPLTALRGSLEVALMVSQTPSEYRQTIREALTQADRLVEGLNVLKEAIEFSTQRDRAQTVSWTKLVRKAISELLPVAESRQIRLDFEPREATLVNANPERLYAATAKCLRMTIEPTPAGEVVQISLLKSQQGVILRVCRKAPPPGRGDMHPFPVKSLSKSESVGPITVNELQWSMLCRLVESQGGSAWTENIPPGRYCVHLRMPLPRPRNN